MFSDGFHVELVGGEFVEDAIVCLGIDAPKPCATNVGDTWAKLDAEKIEHPKDGVSVTSGIGHATRTDILLDPLAANLVERVTLEIEALLTS